MIDKFFNLPLPEKLFYIFFALVVLIYIKQIVLVLALGALIWTVWWIVFRSRDGLDNDSRV